MDPLRQLLNSVSGQAARIAYYLRLGRELASVQAVLAQMSLHECHQVYALLQPHLENSDAGATIEEAFARAHSPNAMLRRTGVAQWFAAAFLETRNGTSDSVRLRHNDIARAIRVLKERVESALAAATAPKELRRAS